jgi:16S rRNA processing protein RimM
MGATEVVVGRIGKPHGVKGELSVELRTDEPEGRFADGTSLGTESPGTAAPGVAAQPNRPTMPTKPSKLTVRSTRWHQSRLLVTFEGIGDRNHAEVLRGLLLLASVDDSEAPEDPEEFYDHQLVGLRVVTVAREPVGELVEILHGPAQDLLSVRAADGREILIPFVAQLVPTVDVPNRLVVVEDLPGLLTPAIENEEGGT